jgi:hypothetical protein
MDDLTEEQFQEQVNLAATYYGDGATEKAQEIVQHLMYYLQAYNKYRRQHIDEYIRDLQNDS